MILKRKLYKELIEWKDNKDKECLLVKGARQVGKTFLIETFGKENYTSFVELNFIFHPELIPVFNGSLEVDDILLRLSAHFRNVAFIPGKTLIFLDEIQRCPNARTALKSFAIDNRFDVIASGSLLGLHYGQDPSLEEDITSVPVGYEKQMVMHSMDFEEFLWAAGMDIEIIEKMRGYFLNRNKIPEDLNGLFMDYFRKYMVVGGMPAVVAKFVETKNYALVHDEQKKILDSYADDINKHASTPEKVKIKKCFDSIPRQLAKENKKFQYSTVESRGNSRKFGSSIDWLNDAAIVHVCSNLSLPSFPLDAYAMDEYFKAYVHDTGLLVAMYGFEMKRPILDQTLTGPAKGGIFENVIADMLVKRGYVLHYFKEGESNYEIEFVISKDASVIPIEVKAKRGATVSLNSFIERFEPKVAYKFIDGNLGVDDCKISLPHYMVMFL